MIVKNYILPMFESDEKKYLKRKYTNLAGNRQSLSKKSRLGSAVAKTSTS